MRYALDLVYLAGPRGTGARHYQVTHTAHLLPWRVSWGEKWLREGQALRGEHVLELLAGCITSMKIAQGDWLELST